MQLQWQNRRFLESGGHLLFTRHDYPLHLSDIAFVKVGAASGADDLYRSETFGNRDFVCSSTVADGKTRRIIWCEPGEPAPAPLLPHKKRLLERRIRRYDESNWCNGAADIFNPHRNALFTQNSLEQTPLPKSFEAFLPADKASWRDKIRKLFRGLSALSFSPNRIFIMLLELRTALTGPSIAKRLTHHPTASMRV